MTDLATDRVANIELLTSWEGPAKHAPGVLFGEGAGENTACGETDLAAWIAVVAMSGTGGSPASGAIQAKVLAVMAALRQRKGHERLDELKRRVSELMQKHRANGNLTEEELTTRIENLFAQVGG